MYSDIKSFKVTICRTFKPFQVYNVDYYEEKEVASLDHSLHKAPPITVK
jgi:hypothetical protein